jgi:hypothetical protein
MSSGYFNIKLRRVSNELIVLQYYTPEGVQWAHDSSILDYEGSPMGSW